MPKCMCADPGCPCCHGACSCKPTETLYRMDMPDSSGTPMCQGCADDALASGLFDSFDDVLDLDALGDPTPEWQWDRPQGWEHV